MSELAEPRIHTDNKHIDHRGSVSNKPGGFLEDSSPFYTLKFVQIVILMMQIVSYSSRSLSLLFFISTDFQASSTVLDQFWLHGKKTCWQTKYDNTKKCVQRRKNQTWQLHTITRWIIKNTSLQPHSFIHFKVSFLQNYYTSV